MGYYLDAVYELLPSDEPIRKVMGKYITPHEVAISLQLQSDNGSKNHCNILIVDDESGEQFDLIVSYYEINGQKKLLIRNYYESWQHVYIIDSKDDIINCIFSEVPWLPEKYISECDIDLISYYYYY